MVSLHQEVFALLAAAHSFCTKTQCCGRTHTALSVGHPHETWSADAHVRADEVLACHSS